MKHQDTQSGQKRDPVEYQRRNNIRITIRGLVVVYLGWLIFQMIQSYRSGEAGVSFPVIVLTVVVFIAAVVAIVILSYRQWKRGKAQVERMWAEQAAEEKRLAAEENDWTDGDDEDVP